MRILHLTDLHLAEPGKLQYGVVDTADQLQRLLGAVPDEWEPEIVVVSGDISNDDSQYSYRLALELVGQWAESRGLQTLWVAGNHDQSEFVELLHDPKAGHHLRGVVETSNATFALLDTRSPGFGYGTMPEIGAELDRLQSCSGERIIVMHHPPLPAPSALHHALRLRGYFKWAERVRGAEVSTVLSGHYHLPMRGLWGGAEVIVGPAVANLTTTEDWCREAAVDLHGAQLVETSQGRSAQLSTIWLGEPDNQVFQMSPEQVVAVAQAAGHPNEPGGGIVLPIS